MGLQANPCSPKFGLVCDASREDDAYCLNYEQRFFFENSKYFTYWLIYLATFTIHNTSVVLTHWGRGKMAAIFLTTFWNAFSWIKMCEFCLRFHWNVFGRFELTIFHHYLHQWWLAYWRIYASLGLNELIMTVHPPTYPPPRLTRPISAWNSLQFQRHS